MSRQPKGQLTITQTLTVNVVRSYVSRDRMSLNLVLDTPWSDLTDAQKSGLFKEAVRIANEHHPTLEEWWTPSFIDPVST